MPMRFNMVPIIYIGLGNFGPHGCSATYHPRLYKVSGHYIETFCFQLPYWNTLMGSFRPAPNCLIPHIPWLFTMCFNMVSNCHGFLLDFLRQDHWSSTAPFDVCRIFWWRSVVPTHSPKDEFYRLAAEAISFPSPLFLPYWSTLDSNQ